MNSSLRIHRILALVIPVAMLIGIAIFATSLNNGWNEIISSDGRGYYHYFLEYFITDENRQPEREQSYLSEHNGQSYTKYSIGTSILLSPFFGLAYGIATITGDELTGYSTPFQLFVRLGSLCYLILGGFMLFRLLLTYHIKEQVAYFTVLAFLFGTNLLYYGVLLSALSHVYSFTTITAWALCIRTYFKTGQLKYFLWAAIAFGTVVLLRPFNILVVLAIPLLTFDLPTLGTSALRVVRRPWIIIVAGLIFCSMISIQLLVWYDQTGQWILYGYANEGFYFTQPKIVEVLFSFNKGLFIYTPLLLVAMVGIWPLYRKHRMLSVSFIAFFLVITYFISSWWCWNYASHFGLRPYIDFYAFLAIPLAAVLSIRRKVFLYLLALVVLSLIALNLIQSYQTKAQILHPIGMDCRQYQYVFLRTGEQYEHCLGGHNEVPIFAPDGLKIIHSETMPEEVLVNTEFPKGVGFIPHPILTESDLIHWKISLEKFEFDQKSTSKAIMVLEFRVEGSKQPSYYYTFKINEVPIPYPEKWTRHTFAINTPSPSVNDKISCYIWNREKERFKVRNFQVEILTAR